MHQWPLTLGLIHNNGHHLPQGDHIRATKFIGFAGRIRITQNRHHGGGHIADVNRLEAGPGAADERQRRGHRSQFGKAIEKPVIGAKNHAWTQDYRIWERCLQVGFTGSFGPRIGSFRLCISANCRYLHHRAYTGSGGSSGNHPGCITVNFLKAMPPVRCQQTDQVDHVIGAR